MKIKICGLKSLEDIQIVNKYQPDFAGFVFAGEKRRIEKDTAVYLRRELSQEIAAVGVFVNEAVENIARLWERSVIQVVQLHGEEDLSYLNRLREVIGAPIIKVIRVRSVQQIKEELKLPCDYILYDTYSEHSYGGVGKRFEESLLLDLYQSKKSEKPYFVAGGLTPENLSLLDYRLNPYGVDVSSGVESLGRKDETKVKEFIRAVRNLETLRN